MFVDYSSKTAELKSISGEIELVLCENDSINRLSIVQFQCHKRVWYRYLSVPTERIMFYRNRQWLCNFNFSINWRIWINHFPSRQFHFILSFTRRTIKTDRVLLRLPHWKMCKLYDVPNSIQADVSMRSAQIRKHSAYANIHHYPRSGKPILCRIHHFIFFISFVGLYFTKLSSENCHTVQRLLLSCRNKQ